MIGHYEGECPEKVPSAVGIFVSIWGRLLYPYFFRIFMFKIGTVFFQVLSNLKIVI